MMQTYINRYVFLCMKVLIGYNAIMTLITWSWVKFHRLKAQSSLTRHPSLGIPAKLWGYQATYTSDHLGTNSGVPTTSSSSIIGWDDSQDLGKHYTHNYSFIIIDINKDHQNEKMHRMRSMRVLNAKFLCPQDYIILLANWCISPNRKFIQVQSFIGISLRGYIWLSHWTQSPAPLSPSRSGVHSCIIWFKAPTI